MNVIYNKLVRDRIPEIIEKSGRKPIFHKTGEDEYIRLLNEKLVEEMKEYLEDQSVEELADMVEVIYAILDYRKVTHKDFEAIRQHKAAERGAFKERLFLKEISEE